MFAIDFDIGDVVFEDGWDVDLFSFKCTRQQHCLPVWQVVFAWPSNGDDVGAAAWEQCLDRADADDVKDVMAYLWESPFREDAVEPGQHFHPSDRPIQARPQPLRAGRPWLLGRSRQDVHEQTGLSASAVADNDQLATQFGHGWRQQVRSKGMSFLFGGSVGEGMGETGSGWSEERSGGWKVVARATLLGRA